MMHCRMVMLPTLIVLGVLTLVFAAVAIWSIPERPSTELDLV